MSDQDQAPTLTFTGFVFSLMHTAAVHLGDAADPGTGQIAPPNVEAARQMIDILGLLEEKTRGNLSAEERQLLELLTVRAERMGERIETLESILDDETPGWRGRLSAQEYSKVNP